MTRSGRVRSYWSGIRNTHQKATTNNAGGKAVRKTLFEQTGNPIYKEKNFEKFIAGRKGGKPIKVSHIRSSISTINKKQRKELKKEWLELKKEGAPVGSFKAFLKANLKDEENKFIDVAELFNSP
jgi:hypothetical protein